ncbi:MAG: glycosyltransferase [Clostridiales bacterium]|jgi:1,2-diacylglycerol 3-alpha-glucosyltransferase|nr:glycosyltransferase [Clostridiales bacterium]
MVITLVTDTFNINNNGTTISATRFAESLSQRGHQIRVITCGDTSKSGKDADTGFEMFYLPELKVPIASRLAHKQHTLFAKPVRATLEKAISGSDIVHIYQPWALGSAAQRIAKRMDIPAIAAFHIQPENITYNISLKWFPPAAHLIYFLYYLFFYRRFSHIHCPSKFIAAQLRSHGYRARLHVISNGVHPAFTPSDKPKEHTFESIKVLMVGRLSPEKRQDVLIRAVMKSRYADRIQLHFAGNGPWEKKLRRLGSKLTNPPVFGYYNRDELIKLIHDCDLYIHSSDIEIEGISCIEAFACGLVPVISDSKRSAAAQFALGPQHLFKAGSPESLAEKIDYWLDNPQHLKDAGKKYARFGRQYALERSIRKIENVYSSISVKDKNEYHRGFIFKLFARLFYTGIASPILLLWTRFVLGVKVYGRKNLRGLKGALTVCNHVHLLDSALVGLAVFPRRVIFPTLPQNVKTLWPGKLVRVLGGFAIPDSIMELKTFFDEMEFLLMKNHIVHFFPEGELKPYDTGLRSFKKGAFHLAAQARVPIVPMSITFEAPKGLMKIIRKKPVMRLHVGRPIEPVDTDLEIDSKLRMKAVREQMDSIVGRFAAS